MIKEPKIVLYDIEILADLDAAARNWFKLSTYPGITLRADLNSIICFAWKVVGDPKIHSICAWDEPEKWAENVNDDKWICEAAFDVLKDADAIVTHNGKRFDKKFIDTRRMIHRLTPKLPTVPHIDTCSLLKTHAYLSNNKLETAARVLTDERKMESGGIDLWYAVRQRNEKAQDKMRKYNILDVQALNSVFQVLKPYATNIPNYNLFYEGEQMVCPTCGSTRVQKYGFRFTRVKRYQRYMCLDCGAESRTDIKEALLR